MRSWSLCRIPTTGITRKLFSKSDVYSDQSGVFRHQTLRQVILISPSRSQKSVSKLLKDILDRCTRRRSWERITMHLTRKGPDRRFPRASGAEYDHRSPDYGGESVRYGRKPARHFTPDVTAGFTPETSPFEQMSQQELNAQAKTLLQAAGMALSVH